MEIIRNDYNTLPQQVEENKNNIAAILAESPFTGFSILQGGESIVIPNNTNVNILVPQNSGINISVGQSFSTNCKYMNIVIMDNGVNMVLYVEYFNTTMGNYITANLNPNDIKNRTITNNGAVEVYYRFY